MIFLPLRLPILAKPPHREVPSSSLGVATFTSLCFVFLVLKVISIHNFIFFYSPLFRLLQNKQVVKNYFFWVSMGWTGAKGPTGQQMTCFLWGHNPFALVVVNYSGPKPTDSRVFVWVVICFQLFPTHFPAKF